MALVTLFGDKLLTKDGEKPTGEALADKTAIGIYFSAHWCPPCRAFTPELARMFSDTFAAKGMAIVFASSDRDDGAFKDYFSEMPWFALPFEDRDKKNALSKKFKVNGIPSFVILDPEGNTITTDGRDAVSEDPTGANYPWIPPTPAEKAKQVLEALGPDLVAATAGKPFGLYFSAHWCPPCRGFTPQLAKWYNDGLKDKMEIIFVSSDRDERSFESYWEEMPWKALPFDKRDAKDLLNKLMGVNGIPSLAILNSDGTIVTTDGRSKVQNDPMCENFPAGWLPQPFNDVNDDPKDLNSEKCVLALGAATSMVAAVKAVAQEYHEAAGKDISAMPMRFYTAPDGGVTSQLRKLTNLEGDKLVVLDIPDDGAFYAFQGEVLDAAAVRAFLDDVNAGKAERKQLQK